MSIHTNILSAIQPVGTIFNNATFGTLAISVSALAVGFGPASIGCFLLAAGCFGTKNLITDAQCKKQTAANTERLKKLAIEHPKSLEFLRNELERHALDPTVIDKVLNMTDDDDDHPPPLAIMLTLFQASQNQQLEYILTQNSNLHNALNSQLKAQATRQKEMHTDIVRAAERSRTFPNTRLSLLTYNPGEHTRNPYLFSLQRVPCLGRDQEFRELLDFCLADGNEKIWWLWHGPGGFGKSRLAHELCLYLLRRQWYVGRLDLRDRFTQWSRVELIADTLFVIDYAAEHPQRAAEAIATLYERRNNLSDHNHRIRFLLLERSADGPWMESFNNGNSSSDVPLLESSQYKRARKLGNVADATTFEIIEFIFKDRNFDQSTIDGHALVRLLNSVDPLNRPLYSAIVADAIVEKGLESIKHWGQGELLDHILNTEMYYWSRRGVDAAHVNALVLSTLSGDLMLTGSDLPDFIKEAQADSLLPNPKSKHWQTLSDFCGEFERDPSQPLPSLQPDILGEKFLLDRLIGNRCLPSIEDEKYEGEESYNVRKQTGQILRLARLRDRNATAITTLHCLLDHPHHKAMDLLLTCPGSNDPEEAEAWSLIVLGSVDILNAMGDYKRANQIYTDLVTLSESDKSTPEIVFARAKAGVNLINGLAKDKKWRTRADEVYRDLVTLSESDKSTPKIVFARSNAAVNLCGLATDEKWRTRASAVYDELVTLSESDKSTPEIVLARANAGVNLALGYASGGDFDRAVDLLHEARLIFLQLGADEGVVHVDAIIARIESEE